MPDILLIQPPIRDFYLTVKRTVPYGLACIASALRREGFSVQILDALATGKSRRIDLPPEMSGLREFYPGPDISPFSLFHDFKHFGYDFDEIGELARKSGAFLVGISSLFTAYSQEALLTAESVKRYNPHAIVVLGGHHPTEMPEEVLRHRYVDFVVRGEGECSLPALAQAIRDSTPLENVPGIGFRASKGTPLPLWEGPGEGAMSGECEIFLNPPAIIGNLDDTPLPASDLIDHGFYQRKKKPCAVIVASRGCPLKCSYCSIGGASWSRFRLKSIDTIMGELDLAVFTAGARFIDFEDENISFDRKWFLTLLDGIKNRYAGMDLELRAMNGLFPPSLDERVIRSMKEAGFTALNLSLCTTCRDQLKKFRRTDVRDKFEAALKAAQDYGLESVGYIIAGAPGQNPEDSVADLLYLASQKVLAGVSVFYPSPGSADFQECRRKNLIPPHLSLLRATALPISDTTTRTDSATLLRLGRILNFMKSLGPDELKEVETLRAPASNGKVKPGKPDKPDRNGRRELGKLLLGLFLNDGIIRGITPDGKIFEHKTSHVLCMKFRDGIPRNHQ